MSDIKWIKITTNMHEDEKMRLIDAMPERDTIHYVWIRLLVQAGKTNNNGLIFMNENISYTDEMLATLFCRPIDSIRLAIKALSDFQMIEVAPDNTIKILNWDKHQNIEGMERVRAQNKKRAETFREKKKQIEKTNEESNNIAANLNNKDSTNEEVVKQSSLSLGENLKKNPVAIGENDINAKAMELLTHYEKITGIVGGLNFGSLKLAIEMHGEKPVKMAINRALEVNKHDMAYINGILKNWRREGYPKEGGEIINGNRRSGENNSANKNEFTGFKAKKPRNLTAGERKGAEENLI